LPEVRDLFSAAELRRLAGRDEIESRLVSRTRQRWNVVHGPFRPRSLEQPAGTHWSLLVQGVDLHDAKARALLERFNFIPYARLDDVMLSLAPPGGGVGPHFDSYDVFLLQVRGCRRWRIGKQRDLRLVDGAPLRILRNFQPQHEIEVGPGDLLYLPPHYAHDGVALTECITCSIGFRAPARQELAAAFLQWLPDALQLEGRYRDPALTAQTRPAAIGRAMVEQIEQMLTSIRWGRGHVETFVGEYLTEPKPQVWFDVPRSPWTFRSFVRQARMRGIRLNLKTRMLYCGPRVFINGESKVMPVNARSAIKTLANEREIHSWHSRSAWATRAVYDWYRAGYVDFRS